MTNPWFRFFLLLLLSIITFSLGLIRQEYIINLVNASLPVWLPRTLAEQHSYPLNASDFFFSLFHDPRWLSAFIYTLYPVIATSIAVYLLFQKRNYMQLTLLFYSTGLILLFLLIAYSLLSHRYTDGYALAQYLKKIYQEPYASLLLVGSFYWDQKRKENV